MAKAVSRRPLSTEARVRSQVRFVVDRVTLEHVSLRVLRFSQSVSFKQFSRYSNADSNIVCFIYHGFKNTMASRVSTYSRIKLHLTLINYFIPTNALHYFSVFLSLHMLRHLQFHLQGCRREFIIFHAANSRSQLILTVSHCHSVSLIFLLIVISLSSFKMNH